MKNAMGLSRGVGRREFLESLAALSAMSLVASPLDWLRKAQAGTVADFSRLSMRAYRGTEFEGAWNAAEIEGRIPAGLTGTLVRIGPGARTTQGTALGHFFDGDALLTAIRIEKSRISIRSRFVDTPERKRERAAGRMLYDDYGTASPGRPKGYKNPPNIHVFPWHGKFLALSESSHPTAVDPLTLETAGSFDFEGSLPGHVTFTAHPKRDPRSGDVYSYGISKSLFPSLKIYRMDRNSGRVHELHSVKLGGFYPIHDMMMTENHLVFVIPPLKIRMARAALTLAPIADLLEYDRTQPLRIVVARKDGHGTPVEIPSAPSGMVFHHFNAHEDSESGCIVFHSMLMENDSAFTLFRDWSSQSVPAAPRSWITRFEVDPNRRKVISREPLSDGTPADFPCVDHRLLGNPMEHFHVLESPTGSPDPLAFNTLACWNVRDGSSSRISTEPGRTLGEPVFVTASTAGTPRELDGWILHLGYDSGRDQTYLDIREPIRLGLVSRVWLGRFVPLGFHGMFVPS